MKQLLLVFTVLLVLSAAILYTPVQQRELGEVGANGDRNRSGEFIDETTEASLKPLRVDRAPAMATLNCTPSGRPTARNLSCVAADGSRESLRF